MVPAHAHVESLGQAPDAARAVTVLLVGGELDLDNATHVEQELLSLVPEEAEGVVADLSELRYLDSAGIRLFVEVAERLGRAGTQLVLVVPDDGPLRRVLGLVKLDEIVPIVATRERAIALASRPDAG